MNCTVTCERPRSQFSLKLLQKRFKTPNLIILKMVVNKLVEVHITIEHVPQFPCKNVHLSTGILTDCLQMIHLLFYVITFLLDSS